MSFTELLKELKTILKDRGVDFKKELQKLIDSGYSYKELVTGLPFNKKEKELVNVKALNLLDEIRVGKKDIRKLTKNEIETLASYTGAGGTSIGSADEYYTPKFVAKSMWNLFGDLPKNANILDPSAGVGIFGQTKPKDIKLTSIDINPTTAEINAIVTKDKIIAKPFEIASKDIEDNSLDGVITNVPFANRDMALDTDPYFQDVKRLEDYFILKSLQKLKYGKRAIFIVPTGVVDNKTRMKIKKRMLNYGSFIGGIRLPNKIFSHTGANVATDIIIFEKHPKNIIEAIKQGLIINGGIDKYIYENQTNREFLYGNYFTKSGAKNVLGVFIDGKYFQDTELFDGKSYGSQVLTTDNIDTIKEKLNQKVLQEFKNTTQYDKIQISNGVNIFSDEADKILYKSNEYVEFFKDFINKEKTTLKDIKEFREKFNELGSYENNQVLFTQNVFKAGVVETLMAVNYGATNNKIDDKKSLKMYKIIDYLISIMQNSNELKENNLEILNKYNNEIKVLFDKNKASFFKCDTKKITYAEYYNNIITQYLSDIRLFITSNYDVENQKIINKQEDLSVLRTTTFDNVVFLNKYKDKIVYDEEYNSISIDCKELDKEIILNNPNIGIFNGKAYPFEKIFAIYGMKYKEAKNKIESLEFSNDYGLTKKEFDEKKQSMLKQLELYKQTPSVDKLFITKDNVDILIPKSVMGIVEEYANDLYKIIMTKNPFQPKYNKDNTFRDLSTRYSSASLFSQNKNALIGISDDLRKQIFDILKKHNLFVNPDLQFENFVSLVPKKDSYTWSVKPIVTNEEKAYALLYSLIKQNKAEQITYFNTKLDLFCKQNPIVRKAIIEKFENDALIGLENQLTSKSSTINPLREFMTDEWVEKLHGYQNEDINKFSTTLSGVIASQTGLGKTSIAIGTGLKALQEGSVKRILYVVPNNVFDKWKMEMLDGRKDDKGNIIVAPVIKRPEIVHFLDKKQYNKDYQNFIKDKTKRILFITYEQLANFKFYRDTLKELYGTSQKELEANPDLVRKPNLIPEFNEKDWAITNDVKNSPLGFFEDGNFDLVIYDEAQEIKNSATGGTSFKFASGMINSLKGIKSRVISAYLSHFKHKGQGKGTILVTATPFTNTPYEIYQVLKKIGRLKNVRDFKDFETLFMDTQEETIPKVTKPDEEITVKVFKGLIGLDLLRHSGLDLISYRTAEKEAEREVNNIDKTNLKPNENKIETIAELDPNDKTRDELVEIYSMAKEYSKQLEDNKIDEDLIKYFENLNIHNEKEILKLASPFSILSKIDNLAISPQFAKGYIELNVSEVEEDKLNKIVNSLLKKKVIVPEWEEKIVAGELIEKQVNKSYTLEDIADKKGIEILKDDILTLPVVDEKILNPLLKDLKNIKGLFNIDNYPKYKALFKNITKELSENENAKQIIFSLSLSGALVIERLAKDFFEDLKINPYLLLSTLKVEKSKKDDEVSGALAQFQEKYNNSNIPTLLIFTKKASTGVDFNKNTRAVHLVDIPYTPDLWEQAKGRGIRQGNKVEVVNLYTYSTKGTFDDVKIEILENKSAWQNDLLENIDSNINNIDNIAIDQKIIEEAIAKYGVNFTKEQVQEIINEKKDKQAKEIQKRNELKKDTIFNNLKQLFKIKSLLVDKEVTISNIFDEYNSYHIDYSENSATYKLDKPLQALTKLNSNMNRAVKYWFAWYVGGKKYYELKKIFVEEYKNNENKFKDYLKEEILKEKPYNLRYFIKTFKSIMENEDISKAKKEILQKNFNQNLENEIDKFIKKFLNTFSNDEQAKNTLNAYKELVDNEKDKEEITLFEDVLNGKVFMDEYGEVYSMDEVGYFYNPIKQGNVFDLPQTIMLKAVQDNRDLTIYYINNHLWVIGNRYEDIFYFKKISKEMFDKNKGEINPQKVGISLIYYIKNKEILSVYNFNSSDIQEKYIKEYLNKES